MVYENTGLGITEVRAASGIPAGVPGVWWSREITPNGEVRKGEKPVNQNFSHQVGSIGPLRVDARAWSHPIGQNTRSENLRPLMGMGTISSPERTIRAVVAEITGSEMVGAVLSCAAEHGVPGIARHVPWISLVPIGAATAMYYFKRKKGVSRERSAAYGLATWAAIPLAWCSFVRATSPVITM